MLLYGVALADADWLLAAAQQLGQPAEQLEPEQLLTPSAAMNSAASVSPYSSAIANLYSKPPLSSTVSASFASRRSITVRVPRPSTSRWTSSHEAVNGLQQRAMRPRAMAEVVVVAVERQR